MRTVIACLPFASVARPVLGASTLKAGLNARGLACDVIYLNLAFSEVISRWDYERIADRMPHHLLAGEWVFTGCLYGPGTDPGDGYLEVLAAEGAADATDLEVLRRARSAAPGFIESCLRSVPWGDYDVIGLSSSTAQNIATLALARRLREVYPRALIVCGGANWQAEMGAESLRRFPFVDLAFSGEADASLPEVIEAVALGRADPWKNVPGVLGRSGGRVGRAAAPPRPFPLDDLPDPDHDDYFNAWARLRLRGPRPAITLETTRGCWWAEREPCGFCGLDHDERPFRAKSPERVVAELRRLARRYPGGRLHFVDNVVSPDFLATVLPELALDPLPLSLFFSVRPDVTREQVRLAGAVHAHLQPGIESFSDHVLRLMHKGTRGLENIRLLRWCKESGVVPHWNVLWGFPGETAGDYEEMARVIPRLGFIIPPTSVGNVSLDRYSPFYRAPAAHGFHDLRPLRAYSYLHPLPRRSLARLAYAFEHRCDPASLDARHRAAIQRCLEGWTKSYSGETVQVAPGEDGSFCLVDDRPGAERRRIELDALEQALYRACDAIATRDDLRARFGAGDEAAVDARLASFVHRGLMVADGERYLGLALSHQAGW